MQRDPPSKFDDSYICQTGVPGSCIDLYAKSQIAQWHLRAGCFAYGAFCTRMASTACEAAIGHPSL